MKFCDKLVELRKEKGYSQEQLSYCLGVSRQSVSKWEAGASMPELSKLIQLSEIFDVTVDYLVKDQIEERNAISLEKKGNELNETQQRLLERLEKLEAEKKDMIREYEYKSEKTLFGLPLVHIHTKFYRDWIPASGLAMGFGTKAKGIVAIGNNACGVIGIGLVSKGLLSLGIFSAGGFSLGLFSLGLLSAGVISLGGLAIGVVAVGAIAAGVSAIGIYATGCAALAKEAATGVATAAYVAAGSQEAKGTFTMRTDHLTTGEAVRSFLQTNHPGIPEWIIKLLILGYK